MITAHHPRPPELQAVAAEAVAALLAGSSSKKAGLTSEENAKPLVRP
jgi:hypothetical protein